MGEKRDYADLAIGGESPEPASKRSKGPSKSKTRQHQNGFTDPTWGQKYVFTSDATTTVPLDPDVDFEDDADAMEYLKSVRHEASSIPHLLVAPKLGPQLPAGFQSHLSSEEDRRSIYNHGTARDDRGFYYDGAYTAMPDNWDRQEGVDWEDGQYYEQSDSSDPDKALDEAYFGAIISRFLTLRTHLRTPPPDEAVAALPRTHSPYVGHFGPRSATFTIWSTRLRTTDPLPVQVAAMDRDGVLRVLRVLMGGKFLRRGSELRERTSRWLWALLARLPDAGDLGSSEVVWVRDLAKRAVLMTRSLDEMAGLRAELGGEALGDHDGDGGGGGEEEEEDGEAVAVVVVDEGIVKPAAASPPSTSTSGEASLGQGEPSSHNSIPTTNGHPLDDDDDDDDKMEEGEISEGEVAESPKAATAAGTLDDAKARLLAQLEEPSPGPEATGPGNEDDESESESESADAERARMNTRATLNMILTVAGEFYGQRDMLEFRDPFSGV